MGDSWCLQQCHKCTRTDKHDSDVLLRHMRSHGKSPSGVPNTVNEAVDTEFLQNGQNYETSALPSVTRELPSIVTGQSPVEAASTLLGLHLLPSNQSLQSEYTNHAAMNFLNLDHSLRNNITGHQRTRELPLPALGFPRHDHSPRRLSHTNAQNNMSYQHDCTTQLPPEEQYPQSAVMGDALHTPSDLGFWEFDPNLQFESWLVGDDFDLRALNRAIATSINPFLESSSPEAVLENRVFDRGDEDDSVARKAIEDTSKRWFTYLDGLDPGQSTSGTNSPRTGADPNQVDETYRANLRLKLRQRPHDDWLPSADFLNICIRLYFTRFGALFPIVHSATFRPSAENSLLLMSMCSIGSLFIGSANAAAQGTKIFETLNKCILASWERYISRSSAEVLYMIQAALIGQTYGMLSGDPRHLLLVEAFHGTIIAWARQTKMFKNKQSVVSGDIQQKSSGDLALAWNDWVLSEATIRVVLGLHVHDAELATIFHHEPLLRHGTGRLPLASSDRAWNASTAKQWKEVTRKDYEGWPSQQSLNMLGRGNEEVMDHLISNVPVSGKFNAYVLLQGIGANVCDSRQRGQIDASTLARFSDDLILWYKKFCGGGAERHPDPFCSMILWHHIFISLFVDFDMFERAIGREGAESSRLCRESAAHWAHSIEARRCIIHASLIQTLVEALLVSTEPAIHVPRILFHAALVWFCFTTFPSHLDLHVGFHTVLELPEFRVLNIKPSQIPFEVKDIESGRAPGSHPSALCGLTDHLQRISHWGISKKLASILGPLIYGDVLNGMEIDG